MKTLSTQLRNLLATRQFYVVDCHTFTLANGGGTLRYCSADIDITLNGNLYSCGSSSGILIDREGDKAKYSLKTGVEVDTLSIALAVKPTATVNGISFQQAVARGMFDGAEYTLQRAYMPTVGDTSAGGVTVFGGRLGEINANGDTLVFSINSHLELLNISLPRNVYQAQCANTLFDGGCGLVRSSFVVGVCFVVASPPSTANFIYSTFTNYATDYFTLGVIQFQTGALAGMSRTIKAHSSRPQNNNDEILLLSPFPVAPAAGDSFVLYPGCNKLQATCLSKFNNLAKFRGFPFIPENSTAI